METLPYGLNISSKEYQRRQEDARSGLEGVFCVVNDDLEGGKVQPWNKRYKITTKMWTRTCSENKCGTELYVADTQPRTHHEKQAKQNLNYSR